MSDLKTALHVVLDRHERVIKDAQSTVQHWQERNRDQEKSLRDTGDQIREYRECVQALRKACRDAKVPAKKMPRIPKFHLDAVRPQLDDDIPF